LPLLWRNQAEPLPHSLFFGSLVEDATERTTTGT